MGPHMFRWHPCSLYGAPTIYQLQKLNQHQNAKPKTFWLRLSPQPTAVLWGRYNYLAHTSASGQQQSHILLLLALLPLLPSLLFFLLLFLLLLLLLLLPPRWGTE